jgi:hypothetical protein
MQELAPLSDYERLKGEISVVYAPGNGDTAAKVQRLLRTGTGVLSGLLDVEPPRLEALLVSDEDWDEAPRESERIYPRGLPYFTRSIRLPALVLPLSLSPAFQPRTEALYPIVVWHELAHAFVLQREIVRTPVWLREFVPQTAAAVVARKERLPLAAHLSRVEHEPDFTIRNPKEGADADEQMAFQNLLLNLGTAAAEEFGDEFLKRLVDALWEEKGIVGEKRSEQMLAGALGPRGREWLESRPEF